MPILVKIELKKAKSASTPFCSWLYYGSPEGHESEYNSQELKKQRLETKCGFKRARD